MSLADTIIAMAAAGCSSEQMAAVARQFREQEDKLVAEKRAKDAERQRKSRASRHAMSRDVTVTPCDSCDPLPPLSPLKEKSPPITPSKENNPPISTLTETAREARSLAVRAAFDAFWRHWPHKVGKPAAEKAFAKCSGEIEAILIGIDRYVRDKPPDRPWLNPATFLNQRRWEDAPAEISSTPSQSQKGGFASLLAKSMGLKNGREGRNFDEAVRLLPLDNRGERGDGGYDDSRLPGDVIDLLAVRSG